MAGCASASAKSIRRRDTIRPRRRFARRSRPAGRTRTARSTSCPERHSCASRGDGRTSGRKIKNRYCRTRARKCSGSPVQPLYARAVHAPRPWGVTALFTEYTGTHEPMPLVWNSRPAPPIAESTPTPPPVPPTAPAIPAPVQIERPAAPAFATVADLARAIKPERPCRAGTRCPRSRARHLHRWPRRQKACRAVWFRAIFPKLSAAWRECLLDALADAVVIPNHVLSAGATLFIWPTGALEDLKALAASMTVSVRPGRIFTWSCPSWASGEKTRGVAYGLPRCPRRHARRQLASSSVFGISDASGV
jgi:hypothetical protein